MRILGINGSLRRGSHNAQLLRAATGLLPAGARLELWRGLKEVPPFDEDDEPTPPRIVEDLRVAIREADAVLIATPEYNGSLPGQLKNALDWASRPFDANALRGKPTAVVGASTGLFGAVWAQADARRILALMGADVIDLEVPVAQAQVQLGPDGRLLSDELTGQLRAVLRALCSDPQQRTLRQAA